MKIEINIGEDKNRHRGHRQSLSWSPSDGDVRKANERIEEKKNRKR